MFDPAALGTLIIGLEAVRADEDRPAERRRRPHPRHDRPSRLVVIAAALRRVADRIDRVDRRPLPAEAPC